MHRDINPNKFEELRKGGDEEINLEVYKPYLRVCIHDPVWKNLNQAEMTEEGLLSTIEILINDGLKYRGIVYDEEYYEEEDPEWR